MATVSSHVLDSVSGSHAAGIRCQLFRLGPTKRLIFDVIANDEGRIAESVVIDRDNRGAEFEIVFHSSDYFAKDFQVGASIVETVVIRFRMNDDDARYHLPVMLSPHSCSAWWSD